MSESPNRNTMFLSQPIGFGSPMLLRPNSQNRSSTQQLLDTKQTTNDAVAWQWKIEARLIPSLNIYYMLEPTSITLKQIPITLVETRMSNFLRIESISYTYDASTVRLDCVTSNMLKFVVQFWRVGGGPDNAKYEDPNQALTVELQRRAGSSVELHDVRKKMFRALLTGDQPAVPTDGCDVHHPPLPDTIMAEINAGYDRDAGRNDAFEICLRLLESRCIDQGRLGLESVKMMTDPSVVSRQDATFASRAIVFRESDYGERLQSALAGYFTNAQQSDMDEYEDSLSHGIALTIISNALQLVLEDMAARPEEQTTIDTSGVFWAQVAQDLFRNVERATTMPHEGAMSAKCIRLLTDLQGRDAAAAQEQVLAIRGAGLRSCLAQAHKYGQRYHYQLERETNKLLAMDTENFVRAH